MPDRKLEFPWDELPRDWSHHQLNPETGLFDRVRKHQVRMSHRFYYDDETQSWYEIDWEEWRAREKQE